MKSRTITTKILKPAVRGPGRPRAFDPEQALDIALELFWRHGYEGVSISDLTRAMGLSPTSLYAAFGAKADLYARAVERYRTKDGGFEALVRQAPGSAREAIAGVLRACAGHFTEPGHPPGCMISTSGLACAEEHRTVALVLAAHRQRSVQVLAERIRQGVDAGELPAGTDPLVMARFYGTVLQGMAVQARDGADRQTLATVAEMALEAWGSVAARAGRPAAP